jgi:hypothetical protein
MSLLAQCSVFTGGDKMADIAEMLLGKWSINSNDGRWHWVYTFSKDDSARWYDPNVKEGGRGRWAIGVQDGETRIILTWTGSATKEYFKWVVPTTTRMEGHVTAAYGTFDTTAEKIVDATTDAEGRVRQLHTDGKITFAPGSQAETFFTQALNHDDVAGVEARHTFPLLKTLIALSDVAGSLGILRTFAPNQGPHGKAGRCEAVDIAAFGTFVFEYHIAKNVLIEGVAKLIHAMPDDITFDLGLVRPVGGVGGCDPTRDVFFTVKPENVRRLQRDPSTHKVLPNQPPNAVEPGTGWGIGALLPDAKRAIDVARTGKKLGYIFPDGADHVHLRAY